MGIAGRQNALNGHLTPSNVKDPTLGLMGGDRIRVLQVLARTTKGAAGIAGHPDSGTRRTTAGSRRG